MTDSYLEKILATNILREKMLASAVSALNLPTGSRGLDAGCGAGLQCLLLADATGPNGHVTGLDISADFLAYGREIAKQAELANRISFVEGNAAALPFEDNSLDWVWSADCIGYGPWDPMPMLEECKRVIKPGGTLALLAWSSEHLLPGYPALEARLRATTPGLAPFEQGMGPTRHFLRTLGRLRQLGCEDCNSAVFADSVQAPLSKEELRAMTLLFDMRWPGVTEELSQGDAAEFERLCLPASPDFVLTQPDYYAFFTCSMFWGTVR